MRPVTITLHLRVVLTASYTSHTRIISQRWPSLYLAIPPRLNVETVIANLEFHKIQARFTHWTMLKPRTASERQAWLDARCPCTPLK